MPAPPPYLPLEYHPLHLKTLPKNQNITTIITGSQVKKDYTFEEKKENAITWDA
jgi:hypothetical protein